MRQSLGSINNVMLGEVTKILYFLSKNIYVCDKNLITDQMSQKMLDFLPNFHPYRVCKSSDMFFLFFFCFLLRFLVFS